MKTPKNSENFAIIADKLKQLNLDPIKIKLMDEEEGEGWSRGQVDNVDLLYRRFLFLIAAFPDNIIVPSKVIDEFWHTHILDTEKYEKDCNFVFGYFVHHFPYLGMRGEEDVKILNKAFEETSKLYESVFKEDYLADMVSRCEGGKCGGSCGGTHCKPKKHINTSRPFLEVPTGPLEIFSKQPEVIEA